MEAGNEDVETWWEWEWEWEASQAGGLLGAWGRHATMRKAASGRVTAATALQPPQRPLILQTFVPS